MGCLKTVNQKCSRKEKFKPFGVFCDIYQCFVLRKENLSKQLVANNQLITNKSGNKGCMSK